MRPRGAVILEIVTSKLPAFASTFDIEIVPLAFNSGKLTVVAPIPVTLPSKP